MRSSECFFSSVIMDESGMTSVFSADGKNVPCTVIEAGPCVVTQVKTVEKDGYAALQLAYGEKKEKNTTKPMMGIFKKAGTTPKAHLAEFKFDEEHNLGDTITVELFNDTEFVDVVGTSKGKAVCVSPVLSVLVLIPPRCSRECAWVARWVATA